MLDRARRILSEAMELEADARHERGFGALNIGMIPTVAPYLLPGTLAALRATDITRDLRLREAQTADLLDGLRSGRLDAVVLADPGDAPDLVGASAFSGPFRAGRQPGAVGALGASPEALRPVGLPPDQLLLLDEGHCLADQALEVCALDRRQTRLDLGASSLSTLCGLVAQGFGLTFLPEIALSTETRGTPALACAASTHPNPHDRSPWSAAAAPRRPTGSRTGPPYRTGRRPFCLQRRRKLRPRHDSTTWQACRACVVFVRPGYV